MAGSGTWFGVSVVSIFWVDSDDSLLIQILIYVIAVVRDDLVGIHGERESRELKVPRMVLGSDKIASM